MQSSTAIAFRALIMLVCLISVPMFAIFGKDLPDVVKGLMEGRKLVLTPTTSESGKSSKGSESAAAESANPFDKSVPYRADQDQGRPLAERIPHEIPPLAGVPTPASSPDHVAPTGDLTGNWRNAPAPNTQPAGFHTPPDAMPVATMDGPGYGDLPGPQPISPPLADSRQPAAIDSTAGARVDPGDLAHRNNPFPATPPANRPPANASQDERFRWAETRLRDMGATHYMLETWGPDNRQYRFGCKMALAGNSIATQYFESIKDDPWLAMENVLQQVEQWQAAGGHTPSNFPTQAGF